MKISDVVNHLLDVNAEHGDIEVTLRDADTGFLWRTEEWQFDVITDQGMKVVEIAGDYYQCEEFKGM